MIKTLFLFILIIVLAWLSQDYFSTDLPKQKHETFSPIHNKDSKVKQTSPIESHIKIKTSISNNNAIDRLSSLLKEDKFYDALSFYLENNTAKNMKYIETYLATLAKNNPRQALMYMQVFLDNEPQSNVAKLIVKTYIALEDYTKAISMIIQIKENYTSEDEDTRLTIQLRETALKHIDILAKRKEYASLISFLEEMSMYDSTDNFYTFRLAQLYMELDKTEDASALLETLKYDEVYAQNAKSLMQEIDKEQDKEYKYAIALEKYGEHYMVRVDMDGTMLNLMLDTGATYILIDNEKGSMFDVIQNNLVLHTAGDDIVAGLCNVNILQIGNLELYNIKVTTAPFKRDVIDGLLGMNFFKQFKFFINQDENILYLNPK